MSLQVNEISALLQATRASDKKVRGEAETQIDALVQKRGSEFLSALISVSANSGLEVSDCQSALLILKNCIEKYWSPGFEQFVGPPLSHETRQLVRAKLLQLLGLVENQKIRSACALVISRIASLEYPEQWPDLVEQTVQYLNGDPKSTSALGGLALFKELLLESLREEDFMFYGENVLQCLLNICENPSTDGARLLAVECFHECITFLLMGDDDHLPHLELMAARFIPQWCQRFSSLLREELQNPSLVIEIVNSLREVDSAFPQNLEPELLNLFKVAQDLLEFYNGSISSETKSNLALIMDIALQNSVARKHCLSNELQLAKFITLLLNLSTIPDELADQWVDDYNEFVSSELELTSGDLNPRSNAATLVAMTGHPGVLLVLLNSLEEALSNNYPTPNVEACFFLVSNLLSQVDIKMLLAGMDVNRFQQFLSALDFTENELQSGSQSQLLVSRKVTTAGLVAKYSEGYLQNTIREQLSTLAFRAPLADSCVVKVAQLQVITEVASRLPEAFRSYQIHGLMIVASLIDSAEDDTPAFLAEAYGATLKLDYEIVVREDNVIDLLFNLSGKDTTDIELNAQILDVVGELLDTITKRPVVERILSPIINTIQSGAANGFDYSGDLYFALDLATAVFEHQDVQFSGEERETMLQSFYQVITTTEDPQILQVASFAYAGLVQNIEAGISPVVASNVLKVAAQLLSPGLDDSAALASGKLVSAIIDKFGSELGNVLYELIEASAKRLASAANALLIETLVMVFCELTLRNAAAVVGILSSVQMLEAVMKQWIPTFEVVRGADEINKNIRAFQMLFELDDPSLSALLLPDEPIRTKGEILTRRKAKNIQFTQTPVPLKILKLLIRELLQAPRPSTDDTVPSLTNNENSSEDDWDDELALNDEGETLDFRTYNLILDWFKKHQGQPLMDRWFSQLRVDDQKALANLSKA